MTVEYASRGLVGMLTPQANTTVEPEMNLLWPPGVAMLNARLVSEKPSISARLVDYFENYASSLRQFANAPLGVVGAACTGASYLAGREREAKVVEAIATKRGTPFVTAGLAVVDALRTLGARKIGLVSPYPDDLNQASIAYWESFGFVVTDVAVLFKAESGFHPIYSLDSAVASAALRTLEYKPVDSIVMLGTGMPTLVPIAASVGWDGAPVMSCNLCLAWRCVEWLDSKRPSLDGLQRWIRGEGWMERLKRSERSTQV